MSTAYDAQPSLSLGPNYGKVWVSAAASNLADGIFWIALPLIAVTLTTSPALVAGVAIAADLPWIVFVLFAGAIADRVDRRLAMRNVQVLRLIVLLLLAGMAVSDTLSLPLLYVAAFVLGIGETFYDTAGMSIMPSLVPKELLSKANSRLYAAEMAMNELLGPLLGGVLVAIAIPVALVGSTIGYVIAAIGLTLVVGRFKPKPTNGSSTMLADIRQGLRFLWHTPVLRTMAIMVAGFSLADSAVFAVFVLYAVAPGPMGLDEVGFGVIMASFAVGGLLGAALVERFERRLGRSNILFLTVIASALVMLIPLVTAEPLPVMAGFFLLGVLFMAWNVITVSLRQRITPDPLLGRVNAAYRFFGYGAAPIGALLGGLVAELLGVQAVFLFAALITLALLWFRRTLTDQALDRAEAAALSSSGAAA